MDAGIWRKLPKDEASALTAYIKQLFEPHRIDIGMPAASRTFKGTNSSINSDILMLWDIAAHVHNAKIRFKATVKEGSIKIWRHRASKSGTKIVEVEVPIHQHDRAKLILAKFISQWMPNGGDDGHREQESET